MAILRGLDGKFYEVPDKDLAGYEMSEDRIRELIGPSASQGGPGGVDPYGFRIHFGCWRNHHWHNCHWHNCY